MPTRFTVPLEASRRGGDSEGRRYTVTVTATGSGTISSAGTIVIVPHSRGAGTPMEPRK